MTFPAQTVYPISGGATFGGVAGPDGNIWLADVNLGFVKVSPSGTVIASYSSSPLEAQFICSDGTDLWASGTATGSTTIARCTTAGVVTTFTPGLSNWGFGIVYEPTSGCLFVGDTPNSGAPFFRKINLSGALVATYTADNAILATLGPDGNIWGHHETVNGLSRCTPTGTVTNFTPFSGTISISGQPNGLFSDGTYLWACDETTGNGLWRVSMSGTATKFPVANASMVAGNLGLDGYLYVGGGLSSSSTLFQVSDSGSVVSTAAWADTHANSTPNGAFQSPSGNSEILFTTSTATLASLGPISPASSAQLVMPL